jgi:CrcB protein
MVGAPLRYWLGERVQDASDTGWPWGTLAVNVLGCLAIGVLLGLAERHDWVSREVRLLLVTGFLGSFTTFSAFGWETYGLLRADEVAQAGAYVVASVVLGLVAVWAGAVLARV